MRDRARKAAYYAANIEARKAYNHAYYAANPEKVRAISQAWSALNPDKVKANTAAYRDANRDKINAYHSARHAANPELTLIKGQNYRARKYGAGDYLSKDLAAKLYKLQRGKCACGCGMPLGDDFHRDHIMPLALGGTNTDDNIQLLRQRCNSQKSAKHPVEFMQERGFLI